MAQDPRNLIDATTVPTKPRRRLVRIRRDGTVTPT
jgi:hypothetical protein